MSRLTRWIIKKIYGNGPDPQSLLLEKVDVPTMVESAKGWNRYGLAMAIGLGIQFLCIFLLLIGLVWGMDYLGVIERDLGDYPRRVGIALLGMWMGIFITLSAIQSHIYRTVDERYESDIKEWMEERKG